MIDGEMGWDAPGPFNIPPEEEDTSTVKPIPQECVGKDQNIDLLMAPSINVEDGRRRGVESCLVRIKNDANKIRHRPRISYCESANWGLTKSDIKMLLFIIL